MLKQRILTALVLLAILLPALFHPSPVAFTAVILVLMAAAAWEWGRLNACGPVGSVLVGAACLALCAASWALGWVQRPLGVLWLAGGGCWVLGSAWLLRAGVPGWPRVPAALRLVAGIAALWMAWMAVVQARALGVNFLLSVMCLVWMADIAVYRKTVQTAFKDIRTSLTSQREADAIVRSMQIQVESLRRSVDIARLQYDNGYTDYLTVLDAERQLFAAELQLASALRDRLDAVVSVCMALGGGWEDPGKSPSFPVVNTERLLQEETGAGKTLPTPAAQSR